MEVFSLMLNCWIASIIAPSMLVGAFVGSMILYPSRAHINGKAREEMRFVFASIRAAQTASGVIVGDPGAGKTTLLKYLTLKSAGKQLSGLPDLPIYIELNAFASSEYSDLLDFASANWDEKYGFPKAEARTYQETGETVAVTKGGEVIAHLVPASIPQWLAKVPGDDIWANLDRISAEIDADRSKNTNAVDDLQAAWANFDRLVAELGSIGLKV